MVINMNFNDIKINITNDYESLVDLFIKNELEFSLNDEVPTDLIKCWKAKVDDKLIGGCVLALRQGEYIIDGIAVEPEYRAAKLGKKLLDLAIAEVRKRDGKCLYLVARAPNFFRKQGFDTIGREYAPNFFECFTCPQNNKTCFPEVMKLSI